MENWVKIKYDGDYSVSDLGRVRNNITNKYIGSVGRDGYIHCTLKLKGKVINKRIHNLVWEYFIGIQDKNLVIDHKNSNKQDNRLDNLRQVSSRENRHKDMNLPISGVIGVSWNTEKQRWIAQISINNKRYKLGARKTIEEAKQLYDNALINNKWQQDI